MSDEVTLPFSMVVNETPKAWLLQLDWVDDDFKIWMPKSSCDIDEHEGEVYLPLWLMKKIAEEHELQEFWDIVEGCN